MKITSRYLEFRKIKGGIFVKVYERVNKYLKDNGIKQNFLSEKTGIPENTLSMVLNGKIKLDADKFVDIIKALGLDPNEFIYAESTPPTETSDSASTSWIYIPSLFFVVFVTFATLLPFFHTEPISPL